MYSNLIVSPQNVLIHNSAMSPVLLVAREIIDIFSNTAQIVGHSADTVHDSSESEDESTWRFFVMTRLTGKCALFTGNSHTFRLIFER